MPDKLDELFVSNDELNVDVLFEILKDKVKITEGGEILILGKYNPLIVILFYALSKKVMFIKNKASEETFGPAEISKKTGLPNGTSKVYVRKLEQMGFLIKKDGTYLAPNFALNKIKEFINENVKNKS